MTMLEEYRARMGRHRGVHHRQTQEGTTMKTFTLEIECENAIFEDWQTEVARILRGVADRLDRLDGRQDQITGNILDLNGNTVGSWEKE